MVRFSQRVFALVLTAALGAPALAFAAPALPACGTCPRISAAGVAALSLPASVGAAEARASITTRNRGSLVPRLDAGAAVVPAAPSIGGADFDERAFLPSQS